MLRVLVAQDGPVGRYAPVDAEARVENADAPVGFGMVEIVALVLEHRHLAQHGETVGKASRDEELPVVVLGQLHRHMLPVGGRAFADIDRHVEHRAPHAPHQFGLRERRTLEMQSAHHPVGRHAFIVLHELYRADFLTKLALRKTLEKSNREHP